ncbi:MAG: hypothetical protein V4538_06935 [Bacteroidota bacterium]
MDTLTAKPTLRMAVFLAIILNVFFNLFYNKLFSELLTIQEVSQLHYNFFTPAPYTFIIWGVIYITFIDYGFYQLLAAQRNLAVLNLLAWPMIIANILCSVWLVLFASNQITGSLVLIIMILVCAMFLFFIAEKYRASYTWFLFPFSLFFGWISVATIANFSTWLAAMNWDGGTLGLSTWTIIMMVLAVVAALVISIRFKNWVYPLVITWAITGISIANISINPIVSYSAVLLVVILLAWLVAYFSLEAFRKSNIT